MQTTLAPRVLRLPLWNALAVYALWAVATWWLEGRVDLLQRPDPLGRSLYVLIANLLIGIGVSSLLLRAELRSGGVTVQQLGFRSLTTTLLGVGFALFAGLGLLVALRPASLHPVALLNGFAQVLPTTIAEVVVCWVVVGALGQVSAERLGLGRRAALLVAVIVADVLFGVYHFAHSAPFNTPQMVLFLVLPGFLTSAVFFGTRNVWVAVIIHNVLGMKGVMDAVDLAAFSQPSLPLIGIALVAVAGLAVAHIVLKRQPRFQATPAPSSA